jgi:hypothetical protein
MDLGRKGLEESARLLGLTRVYETWSVVPLSQTADLNGELFETVRCGFLYMRFLVFIPLDEDIAIGCFVFFHDHVCFQRV